MKKYILIIVSLLALNLIASSQEITRIWLSFKTNTPSHLIINWQSSEPGNSKVYLMIGETEFFSTNIDEKVIIHHVEVPLKQTNVEYKYMVRTNSQKSKWNTFQGMPTKTPLKIAIFANWGFAAYADISGVLNEKPAFIATCGDNISSLFEYGKQGNIHCVESYLKLVDAHPELFNHIPFMPALGNHDKQLFPRGSKPPANYMIYDTLSTAFTKFFELPDGRMEMEF